MVATISQPLSKCSMKNKFIYLLISGSAIMLWPNECTEIEDYKPIDFAFVACEVSKKKIFHNKLATKII